MRGIETKKAGILVESLILSFCNSGYDTQRNIGPENPQRSTITVGWAYYVEPDEVTETIGVA